MSTANYLKESVEVMVELGVYTQKQADNTEHCTDDAVYAIDALTEALCKHPDIMEQLKTSIQEDKMRKYDNDYYAAFNADEIQDYLLPDCVDLVVTYAEDADEDNPHVVKAYISSKSLEIETMEIGRKVIQDSRQYHAGGILLSIADSEELNSKHFVR